MHAASHRVASGRVSSAASLHADGNAVKADDGISRQSVEVLLAETVAWMAKGHRLRDGMAERRFEMVHQRALATPAAAGSMYFDLLRRRVLRAA